MTASVLPSASQEHTAISTAVCAASEKSEVARADAHAAADAHGDAAGQLHKAQAEAAEWPIALQAAAELRLPELESEVRVHSSLNHLW